MANSGVPANVRKREEERDRERESVCVCESERERARTCSRMQDLGCGVHFISTSDETAPDPQKGCRGTSRIRNHHPRYLAHKKPPSPPGPP